MKQGRGQLTKRIKVKSKELLGYEIDVIELRLMPYTLYTMMNDQKIDPRHCNQKDRDILKKWRKAGHIEGGAGGMKITKEFWDIICEIVFLGYVNNVPCGTIGKSAPGGPEIRKFSFSAKNEEI